MNNLTRLFLPTCIILLACLTACRQVPEGGAPIPITLSLETPSVEINTPSPTPRLATATKTPTETPTLTATPTEVPLPSEFLSQAQEHGFSYEVVDGKVMVNLTDGSSMEINPAQVGDWPMWEDNYLVVKGDNGIPQLRYVEGKGWKSVEQISKIDAFDNTVPGWVVETSPVWDGEPPPIGDFYLYVQIAKPSSGLPGMCYADAPMYLKQWQLIEFMTSDGIKLQSLQIDAVFNNNKQIITVRSQMDDIDTYIGSMSLDMTPKQVMEALAPGKLISPVVYYWGDPSSAISPADTAKGDFNYFNSISPRPGWLDETPYVTELGAAMAIGQVGVKKFPYTYLRDVLKGKYGNFVDLSQDTLLFIRPLNK